MRTTIAVLAISGTLLFACDDPVSDDLETVALNGTCQTSFDPPPFPVPPVFRQIDTGSCTFQGLGTAAFRSTKDIDIQAGTQITSELVLTFANGDELHGTGGGQNIPGEPGTINFDGTLVMNGGTGRYRTATGEARAEGSANMMQRTASFTFVGEVQIPR